MEEIMKKIAIIAVLGLWLATTVAFAQSPTFNITAPADGIHLKRGSSCTIQWTHSAFYDAHPEHHGVLFCGSSQIGSPVPIKNNQYVWTVGQKSDGTWLAPGTYEITMESLDYDELSGPNITIYLLDFKPAFLARRIELIKIPDCPQCYSFDLKQIELEMEGMGWVQVELLKNGRSIANLGRYGRRGFFDAGPVKLQLDNGAAKSPGTFELVVLSGDGKQLLREKINLSVGR
jgi:hypothetical protein